MAEEVVGIIESWETWWSLNEWVTEADVQRIQENARQIKKIAQQLQQDKKQNNQLANFLTFLLSELSNDKIIKLLYANNRRKEDIGRNQSGNRGRS